MMLGQYVGAEGFKWYSQFSLCEKPYLVATSSLYIYVNGVLELNEQEGDARVVCNE